MNVKTFTASTIQEALSTARQKLGDEVVLLESAAATRREPARVTVMADADRPSRQQETSGGSAARRRSRSNGSNPARQRAQNGRRSSGSSETAVATETEEDARNGEGLSRPGTNRSRRYQSIQDVLEEREGEQSERNGSNRGGPSETRTKGRRTPKPSSRDASKQARGRLFDQSGDPKKRPQMADATAETTYLLENQLSLLHERMDRLENRLGEALVGTAQKWAAHPLFSALLEKGLTPSTTAELFQGLVEDGFQPDEAEGESLRWHLAQQLRRDIDLPNSKTTSGAILFVGPSGAGKTSLILKLAKNPSFFGRRNTAIISVLPEDEDERFYRNPAELCRQNGLTAQTVRNHDDMERALERVAHFDQILIDTPPIPLRPHASRAAFQRTRRLVQPVVPLETHLVMNTTRAFDGFESGDLEDIPLSFDCAALTHLDETDRWGRTAEWVRRLQLPIRFVSVSREMPDGVASFSASWFVEEMMDLN